MVKEGFLGEIHIAKVSTAQCVCLCIWLILKISKKPSVMTGGTVLENSASGRVT